MFQRVAVIVEDEMKPCRVPEDACECMKKPVDLNANKGLIIWNKDEGDMVAEGEIICEGEVNKSIVEFFAPCGGVLSEICVKNEEVFKAGTVIAYIEKMN